MLPQKCENQRTALQLNQVHVVIRSQLVGRVIRRDYSTISDAVQDIKPAILLDFVRLELKALVAA